MLPFTHDQFIAVFAAYNQAIGPVALLAYLVGGAVCALVLVRAARAGLLGGLALAVLWAWTGVVYHGLFFARVNPAALAFAAAFVAQGLLFALAAWRGRLRFDGPSFGPAAAVGWSLVAYSLLLYPLVGILAGVTWPGMPLFGITPCPLTLFTFGVLLLARYRVPWWLLPIPVAWSVVGGSAAALLDIPQDWPLLASGLSAVIILWRPSSPPRVSAP